MTLDTPPLAARAKVACKSCNARRVKCDVAQNQPCWHCKNRGTSCEITQSRRGRYERKQSRHTSGKQSQKNNAGQELPPIAVLPLGREIADLCRPATEKNHENPLPAAMRNLGQAGDVPDDDGTENGPEMLFARMADPDASPDTEPATTDSRGTFYLGEAFCLTFVVKTVCSPSGNETEAVKVHYPVPPSAQDHDEPGKRFSPDTWAYVQAHGCFLRPEQDVSDALVFAFFQCIHPAYPVFDRRTFLQRYTQGTISLLALQAVYLLGATVCSEELIIRTGFADRFQARHAYYQRAKILYDVDYEDDKTLITAALFLLGFWCQRPQDEKETWHWLGSAISLAQTQGMHRSTAHSNLNQRERSLWKRIWWSLYVRDRHSAAALGRPCRIQDSDCDVEPLQDFDFLVDETSGSGLVVSQEQFHIAYAIQMADLAVFLGRILATRFSPQAIGGEMKRQALDLDLAQWEKRLPACLRRKTIESSIGAEFWACMLYANYHNSLILLHRPSSIAITSDIDYCKDSKARASADAMTRIVEDLMSAGTLCQSLMHVVTATFAALGIHAIVIRRNEGIRRQLAENKSRQCMLALSEFSKSWPIGRWILHLFVNLMKNLTGRDLGIEVSSRSKLKTDSAISRASGDTARFQGVGSPDRPSAASATIANGLPIQGMESQTTNAADGTQFVSPSGNAQVISWFDSTDPSNLLDLDFMFSSDSAGLLPFDFGSDFMH